MRASDVPCILLVAAWGCGPSTVVEPEPEAGSGSASSTGVAEASTGADASSTDAAASTTGADDTTAGLGQEHPEVAGRWFCSGFEDPLWLDIEVYRTDPSSIEGRGLGVDLGDLEDPFSSANYGPLAVNPGLPPIQFQFELPYPDFPDFGPLGIEFLGTHEPETDRLVGVMWISTLSDTVMVECERYAG